MNLTLQKHVTKYKPSDSTTVPPVTLTPIQVADAYNFPVVNPKATRNPKVIFVELGGGSPPWDVALYCKQLGVPAPKMSWVGVDGASNSYIPSEADVEVQLDQCVVAAVIGSRLPKGLPFLLEEVTVYGPNSDVGFVDAILKSADENGDAISISWGGPENQWDPNGLAKMHAAFGYADTKGVPVCCAAGDNGATDGETDGLNHCDYPASDNLVTACGGTRLILNADGTRQYEKAWSVDDGNGSTGGGVSALFPAPDYQQSASLIASLGSVTDGSKRLVPDISGNADPASGYQIKADYVDQAVGGTSAVSPLMAALIAILRSYANPNALFYWSSTNLNQIIYANRAEVCVDIVDGSNGYPAGPGFDLSTGVGAVDGTKLLNVLVRLGICAL